MTHAERVKRSRGCGFHRAPGGIPRARDAAFRCLCGAPVLRVCRHRSRPKDGRLLPQLHGPAHATPYPCGHNKARVYHVHNAKLYDAIGQRDVRFRKRSALARTIERVMMSTTSSAIRDFTWLGAEQDKVG